MNPVTAIIIFWVIVAIVFFVIGSAGLGGVIHACLAEFRDPKVRPIAFFVCLVLTVAAYWITYLVYTEILRLWRL